MIKKAGIDLLRDNLLRVEEKFLNFFEKGEARWPLEKHDYLRNHHRNISNFSERNITIEKLKFNDLPDNILQEVHHAFDAFQKGEEYN
jgi:hypothetical protein